VQGRGTLGAGRCAPGARNTSRLACREQRRALRQSALAHSLARVAACSEACLVPCCRPLPQAVTSFILKDAAERGRLGASTFKLLNAGMAATLAQQVRMRRGGRAGGRGRAAWGQGGRARSALLRGSGTV
jgi:hypothetical protein